MSARRVLACDLDGCLFDFNSSFIALLNTFCGSTIPPVSADYPSTWGYPLDGGHVTREQWRDVWNLLSSKHGVGFWRHLRPYAWSAPFLTEAAQRFDRVVFVTARPDSTYGATVEALEALGVSNPLVRIANGKRDTLADIGATHLLDDRDVNFDECASLPGLRSFMLDQPWNRHYTHELVERVKTPFAVLQEATNERDKTG